MIKVLPRNILRFVFLVLLQVLILNNIQLSGFINPYLYVLFILLLPFETPKWALLVIAFLLGLSIDAFTDTIGMHASATVLMAFFRPYVLNIISPRDGYDAGTFPRLYYFGFTWFLKYSVILILIHHFCLFYLEVFRLSDFFFTLWKIILSSFFSLILIIISQYIMVRK